jgi:hypothetical protein
VVKRLHAPSDSPVDAQQKPQIAETVGYYIPRTARLRALTSWVLGVLVADAMALLRQVTLQDSMLTVRQPLDYHGPVG